MHEAAKSFIVRENFEKALVLALETKIDVNFAIDFKGNRFCLQFFIFNGLAAAATENSNHSISTASNV